MSNCTTQSDKSVLQSELAWWYELWNVSDPITALRFQPVSFANYIASARSPARLSTEEPHMWLEVTCTEQNQQQQRGDLEEDKTESEPHREKYRNKQPKAENNI